MQHATQRYARALPESPAAAYAASRKLSAATLASWELGYASDAWRNLLEAMSADGFTPAELVAAGLVKEADGKAGTYYDRFRNRLMFPIRDASGRVVAFTGRALSSDDPAKYLNSPETELYHKSELLFGLDRAKDAIRMRRYTLLMEGQMDVLHAHQAGFQNAVALSGTALTEQHLKLLARYSENLMLVLDADSAGLGATAKAAALALSRGFSVKAVQLPEGKDPADLLGEDAKAFGAYLQNAKPIVDFFLAALSRAERDPHRLLSRAEHVVLPLIAAMKSPMEREHFAGQAARTLGISTEAVRASLARMSGAQGAPRPASFAPSSSTRQTPGEALEARRQTLIGLVHAYPDTALAERVKAEYLRITEAPTLPEAAPPESILFDVERVFGETPDASAADDLLSAFEETMVRDAYQEAVRQLREAESLGETARVQEAETLCRSLAARLAALKR
jgi:DNA primase